MNIYHYLFFLWSSYDVSSRKQRVYLFPFHCVVMKQMHIKMSRVRGLSVLTVKTCFPYRISLLDKDSAWRNTCYGKNAFQQWRILEINNAQIEY